MLLYFWVFTQTNISVFAFFYAVFFKGFCTTLKQRKRLTEVVFKVSYTLAGSGTLWQCAIYQSFTNSAFTL